MSSRIWEGRLGRLAAGLGACSGVAYLAWRVTVSMSGAPAWLALPALAVEVVGVLASLLLVWAVWPAPSASLDPIRPLQPHGRPRTDIDVVVRCSGQRSSAVVSTLLSASRADGRVLLDLVGDPALRALAGRYDAEYLLASSGDLNGLATVVEAPHRPLWFVVEAGDVLAPSALEVGRGALDDPSVAIALMPAVPVERDAVRVGRSPEAFERDSLRPSLGARGHAVFFGSAAVIRAEAVTGRTIGTASPEMAGAQLSTELMAEGWRITAPTGAPILGIAAAATPEDTELRHTAEAAAARWLIFGTHGALSRGRLDARRRLALLAQAVRPLAGIHRGLFIAVVLVAYLDGRLPFRPDLTALLLTWMPWFVLTSVGLALLSGWTLRPSDRGTSSMRLLGPSWRGLLTPNGRPERPRLALAGAFGVRHGAALSGAVALISVVVSLRGLSDRVTHTLEPMSRPESAGLLAVAMWALAMGLDGLQLFGRPNRSRQSIRVGAALTGTMSGRTALLVDLSPEGAAVLSDSEVRIGGACAIDVVLPTRSGCVTAMLPATVRHHSVDAAGLHHLGVEFFDVDLVARQALIEYCLVEPVLARLDGRVPSRTEIDADVASLVDAPRRIGLRAAALVAVSGALASAAPRATSSAGTGEPLGGAGEALAAGVGAGVEMSWLVTVTCAVIAVGVIGGMRPARLRVPARRVRRPSRPER